MTTWSGMLCAPIPQKYLSASAAAVGKSRVVATMPPRPSSLMSAPRRLTSFSAFSNVNAPAMTSAEYSPRLWPAPSLGTTRSPTSVRNASKHAISWVNNAGCVKRVLFSSSRGSRNASSVMS